jgi:hypothetical protein
MRAFKRIQRGGGRIAASALLAAFLGSGLGIGAPPVRAGVCEEALVRCLDDLYNQIFGPFGTVYCGIGFAFCKKYIDPES